MRQPPRVLYSIRIESPRGSDHVELESNRRAAHRRAKQLTRETGTRHHVLTLDQTTDNASDDTLDPLRRIMEI